MFRDRKPSAETDRTARNDSTLSDDGGGVLPSSQRGARVRLPEVSLVAAIFEDAIRCAQRTGRSVTHRQSEEAHEWIASSASMPSGCGCSSASAATRTCAGAVQSGRVKAAAALADSRSVVARASARQREDHPSPACCTSIQPSGSRMLRIAAEMRCSDRLGSSRGTRSSSRTGAVNTGMRHPFAWLTRPPVEVAYTSIPSLCIRSSNSSTRRSKLTSFVALVFAGPWGRLLAAVATATRPALWVGSSSTGRRYSAR
jgi:hypothetical protein